MSGDIDTDPPEAPAWMSANAAYGWQCGYSAAVRALSASPAGEREDWDDRWSDLRGRIERGIGWLNEQALDASDPNEALRLDAKRHGMEVVRDMMRGYPSPLAAGEREPGEGGYCCEHERINERQAVIDAVNLYGDETLHSALDAIDWPDGWSEAAGERDTTEAGEPLTVTREEVVDAIQTAWDDFVGDTGCFPDAITVVGRGPKLSLEAGRGNWATFITDWLNAALAARPAPVTGWVEPEPDPDWRCPGCSDSGCPDCGEAVAPGDEWMVREAIRAENAAGRVPAPAAPEPDETKPCPTCGGSSWRRFKDPTCPDRYHDCPDPETPKGDEA